MADRDQESSTSPVSEFLLALEACLEKKTFVQLSLGKSRGKDIARKLSVTLVAIKGELRLRFLFQYPTRDLTEHHRIDEGCAEVIALLGTAYLSGSLFSTESDLNLVYNKRGIARLYRAAATKPLVPPTDHNRKKNHIVDLRSDYLVQLGVTSFDGQLKPTMSSKFKQINRFVEIVGELIAESPLVSCEKISVTDIGSGKGYLTFALYDYLVQSLSKEAMVTGIELRSDLVFFCNQVAERLGFGQLRFCEGKANQILPEAVDIVIALHACDTATDDAIFRGIANHASIIICAPCCQHQIAPQLTKDNVSLRGIYRFGLLKQRQADLVTDAARALLLESIGYRVKVIEFVSTEHTNKNLMLAAVQDLTVDRHAAIAQYESLKRLFGFEEQELERLLRSSKIE